MLGINHIQDITHVQAWNGPARAFDFPVARIGKGNNRAVVLLFDPGGEDPDHPLVPVPLKQGQTIGHILLVELKALANCQRFFLHPLFDLFAGLVQRIQLRGHPPCGLNIIAKQQLHPERHIIQPAGGINTRTEGKAQIAGDQAGRIAASHLNQCLDPRPALARPNTLQSLMNQDPVVAVKGNHIGHRTERHQIQQFGQVRLGNSLAGKPAILAQLRPQGQHQVKSHSDPAQ